MKHNFVRVAISLLGQTLTSSLMLSKPSFNLNASTAKSVVEMFFFRCKVNPWIICFRQFGQSFLPRLFFDCYQTLSFHKPLGKTCPSLRLYHALDLVHAISDSAQDLDITSTCIWVFPPMSCCFAKTSFPFLLMSPSCVVYHLSVFCTPISNHLIDHCMSPISFLCCIEDTVLTLQVSLPLSATPLELLCLSFDALNHHIATACAPSCAHNCLVHVHIKSRFLLF